MWKRGKEQQEKYKIWAATPRGQECILRNQRKYDWKDFVTDLDAALEYYDQQFEKQHGVCAMCKQASERRLSVDHDHRTGELRGLLCRKCNLMVGHFELMPDEILEYLKDWDSYPFK